MIVLVLVGELRRHVPRLVTRHLAASVEGVDEGEPVGGVLLLRVLQPLEKEVSREVDRKTENPQPGEEAGVEQAEADRYSLQTT